MANDYFSDVHTADNWTSAVSVCLNLKLHYIINRLRMALPGQCVCPSELTVCRLKARGECSTKWRSTNMVTSQRAVDLLAQCSLHQRKYRGSF